MLKIGVVGIKDAWSTEKLLDAVERRTGHRLLVEMDRVSLDLPSGKARWGGEDIDRLDALIIKKLGEVYTTDLLDRLEVLRLLSERGLPIFSNPAAISRVLNRLSCTVTLQSGGIPMPPTVITESTDRALDAVEEFGAAVLKPLFSTKARGMAVLKAETATKEAVEAFRANNPVMYIQKMVEIPGKDLGVVFLGGEYLTTYARVRQGDTWTTSTAFGGKYEPHSPSEEIIDLAGQAQSLFNLDFTCVDVVETSTGPVVFEVSAFGGFKGVEKTADIDAAERYTDHVIAKLKGRA